MRAREIITEAPLSPVELAKRDNMTRFLTMVTKGISFLTVDGQQVKIKNDPETINMISQDEWPPRKPLPLDPTGEIAWTRLQKTPEFGGKGSEDHLRAEIEAMGGLTQQIEAAKRDTPYIELIVGANVVRAAGVKNTPGTPKSDFEIIDENGRSVAWISHKDGTLPKHFGQWGGLSKWQWNEETARFINAVKKKFPDGVTKGNTAVMRPIEDSHLRMAAVYGHKVGNAQFGKYNVNTVLQGEVKVIPAGDQWRLVAHNEWVNGTEITGDYTPVFCARFSSDRNDCGIPYTRMTFYPLAGRKFQELLYINDED